METIQYCMHNYENLRISPNVLIIANRSWSSLEITWIESVQHFSEGVQTIYEKSVESLFF